MRSELCSHGLDSQHVRQLALGVGQPQFGRTEENLILLFTVVMAVSEIPSKQGNSVTKPPIGNQNTGKVTFQFLRLVESHYK